MKNRIFRHLLPLLFLLPSTLAQTVNLPLSSVGDGVGWDKRIGLDDYRLAVFDKAANAPLSVELYSPEINLNDYANKRNVQNYYGDEIYGKNLQISTRFSLEQKAGATGKVAEKTYATSQSHSYDTLYTGSLPQGFYPLPIRTAGNGKNAFSFRLSPGIAVEASQFTVVTRGQFNQDQLAARLTVGKSAIGKVLKLQNFDADGPKEMELFVRFPNGQRRKLTASADTQWFTDAYRVDPDMVGEWAILIRILPTTTQFSNSVALRLLLDNKPYYARMAYTPGEAPKPKEVAPPPPPPAPIVDITLTKTASSSKVTVGDKINYTLTVVNTGPDTATGVTLTDTLPAGLGSINAPEAQVNGNNLTWTIGKMVNGERRVYKVEAVTTAAGKLENNASVKANEKESTLENNRASVSIEAVSPPPPPPLPAADVSIQKTVKTAKVTLGDSVGYTLEILNNGPDTASNVVVEDSLPEGLSLENATSAATVTGKQLNWKIGSLAKGERQTITLQVKTSAAGKITNEASVSASEKDPDLTNNKASASLEVVAPPPPPPPPVVDLVVTKTASQSKLTVGDRVSYTLTVVNNGPDAATEIELSDTLPAGLTLVSAQGAQVSGNTLTWNIIRIAKGAQRTFRVEAIANKAGTLENTASVKGKEQDSNLANNRASATVEAVSPPPPPPPLVDVSIQKTVNPTKVTVGNSTTYTLNIVNNGPDTATNVVVEDRLPDGLSLEASTPAASKNGNQLSWNLGTLTKGERQIITLQVKTSVAGNIVNEASVKATEKDPDLINNKSNVSLEVEDVPPPPPPPAPVKVPQVNLALSKTVEPGKLMVGETARYTLTVVNRGPDTATEIVLEDVLPEGLSLVVANPAAKVAGNRLTWTLASLESGKQQSFSVEANATQAGKLTNNASVSSKEADTDLTNNQASASLEVEEVPPPPPPVIVPQPEPKPAELPPLERESQVLVLAKLAQIPSSGFVILSDKLPNEARYIAGSSRRVNNPQADLTQLQSTTWLPGPQQQGDALPDPIVSGDRLYWVLPYSNTDTYALNYRLAHTGALQMPADRVGVILGIPQARSADAPRTNLGEASPVAQALGLGELRLIQGGPEVLQSLQQASALTPNNLVSSANLRLEILPVRLTTDATSQPALLIKASDAGSYLPINALVTLEVSPEPSTPDAAPTLPGYQVQMVNGQAIVALSDLTGSAFDRVAPTTVQAEAHLGMVSTSAQFKTSDFSVAYLEPSNFSIGAATRPWLVNGAIGIEASFGSGFALKASGSAFARGPVGNFTLTLATDARYRYDNSYRGFEATDLLPPANPYERFPLLGDSSRLGSDARSSDAFFLKLEQGNSYLLYGQLNPGFSGLITAYTPEVNGVQATVRDNSLSLTAFATPSPNANRLEVFGGDATGFYWLQGSNSTATAPSPSNQIPALAVGVKPGTEQLRIVRYDRDNPNLKLDIQPLGRGADYDLDYASGRVRLYRPITGFDANGNPQYLEVAYALATATDTGWQNAQVRYGAQAKFDTGAFGISATYLKFDAAQPALLGVGANLQAGNFQLGAEVGLSSAGGNGTAAGAAQVSYTGDNLQFRLRYQDKGPFFVEPYVGNTSASKDLSAAATLKLGAFSLNANFSSSQPYSTLALTQAASVGLSTQLGSAKFGLGYALERATADKNWLTAGLELPLGSLAVLLNQKIGLGNTNGETGVGLDYAISPNFGIRYTQNVVYLDGLKKLGGQGTLGLRGSFTNRELIQTLNGNDFATADDFGTTNLAVNYDLPGIDGQAARTRMGLETQIPLSSNLSLALGGETILADAGQGSAGGSLGLNFGGDNARGSVGAQASVTATGVKQVYTGSAILQASDTFTVAPAAEYSILPGGKSGGKFSLAAALRTDDWSLLTQNRYLSGIYGNGLEGELRTAYEAGERWFWRGGVAYKLASDIFTGQVSTGLTWYLTDAFGLEGSVSYAFTPVASTPSSSLLFGIGANLRFAPGWSVGAGFNFEALSLGGLVQYLDQRPGFYVRLDWKFDERTFGLK